MREAEDSFYLVSAGAFQRLDHDWIHRWMPKDGSVQFENLTNSNGVLVATRTPLLLVKFSNCTDPSFGIHLCIQS